MTAVTVGETIQASMPGTEILYLSTVADGYTYTSKKFKTLIGGIFCFNTEQTRTRPLSFQNVSVSGQTATINISTSATDEAGTLLLFGRE